MGTQNKLLTWARQLHSGTPLLGAHTRHAACKKLASDKTACAVPFLISALASDDEEVKCIAQDSLAVLDDPDAIDALFLGYLFTGEESLRRILVALGRTIPEGDELRKPPLSQPGQGPTPAENAWQYRNDRDGTVLALVPDGDFLAGEKGIRVHLPAYYLALACVTNAQYARFLTDRQPNPPRLAGWISPQQSDLIRKEGNAYLPAPEKEDLPAVWVTWEGAAAYSKWAGLRLPTELEWEKGARGTDGRLYPWGDEWDEGRPHAVPGEQKPEVITSVWAYPRGRSPYGLCQMIGNVYEWCADWYEENAYDRYATGDLRALPHGEHRLLRGGPWRFGTPVYLRTEYRKSTVWRGGTLLCGFRCAKSL